MAATHCGMAAALRSVVMQPGVANREESRAKAIFHYGEALKVYAANTHPRSHADAHLCMAEARLEGLRGRPTPEVCKAIAGHYSTALSICNRSNDTERVAQCHTSAARACMTVSSLTLSLSISLSLSLPIIRDLDPDPHTHKHTHTNTHTNSTYDQTP